jgi:putative methyltransferase (TIGR04325 family)
MKMRALVRSLVPPVLVKPLARLWPSRERPVLEYYPGGWNGLQNEVGGWNADSVVNQESTKWEAFRDNVNGSGPLGFSHENTDLAVTRNVAFHNIHMSYAYVLALTARQLSRISVLDWGGGLGHYYLLGKAVLPDVEIKFDCRDVPLMCERGRQLCPEINFYEDDRCLENKYDLVMINGALGYFENWKELLPRIIATVQHHLFLTRVLTVRESPSFVALQRTDVYNYHSDMLTQVFNEKEILDLVAKSGLRLVREFVVGDGPTIVGAPEQCRDCGWLFERKL